LASEAHSNVTKVLSAAFPIQNGLKQGDALSPLLFNFYLEYAIRKFRENQMELEFNRSRLVYADVNVFTKYKHNNERYNSSVRNKKPLLEDIPKIRLIGMCCVLSRHQNLRKVTL
jgi:hypothetical protein